MERYYHLDEEHTHTDAELREAFKIADEHGTTGRYGLGRGADVVERELAEIDTEHEARVAEVVDFAMAEAYARAELLPEKRVAELEPGDTFYRPAYDVWIKVLRAAEPSAGLYGRAEQRLWCQRLDTLVEGWCSFGLEAIVDVEPKPVERYSRCDVCELAFCPPLDRCPKCGRSVS